MGQEFGNVNQMVEYSKWAFRAGFAYGVVAQTEIDVIKINDLRRTFCRLTHSAVTPIQPSTAQGVRR
jgi:hypothetical protein